MFHFRNDTQPFRVVGIDPGTNTLGVSCVDLDLRTGQATWMDAQTFTGADHLGSRRLMRTIHGDRFARLDALEEHLVNYFWDAEPHAIISESPYMSRFAATYAALVECISVIRRASFRFDSSLYLETIDPASVKANLEVSGKSGDKSLMTEAVRKLVDSGALLNPHHLSVDDLDEHSVDATAVACYRVQRLWSDYSTSPYPFPERGSFTPTSE